MLGRLPWLAFERRMRAFFFLVFFDMVDEVSGLAVCFLAVRCSKGPTAKERRHLDSMDQRHTLVVVRRVTR